MQQPMKSLTINEIKGLPDDTPVLLRIPTRVPKEVTDTFCGGIRFKRNYHLMPVPGFNDIPLCITSSFIYCGYIKVYTIPEYISVPVRIKDNTALGMKIFTPHMFNALASNPRWRFKRESDGLEIGINDSGAYKWAYAGGNFFKPDDLWERVPEKKEYKLFTFAEGAKLALEKGVRIKKNYWHLFYTVEEAWEHVNKKNDYTSAKTAFEAKIWQVEGEFECN